MSDKVVKAKQVLNNLEDMIGIQTNIFRDSVIFFLQEFKEVLPSAEPKLSNEEREVLFKGRVQYVLDRITEFKEYLSRL